MGKEGQGEVLGMRSRMVDEDQEQRIRRMDEG